MKEALIVLVITCFAFVFARQHLVSVGFERQEYLSRCSAWLLLNCAVFALGSLWLYLFVSLLALIFYSWKDSNPLALFCFLLFAVPDFPWVLPGPGSIDTLLSLTHQRTLAIIVLIPVAWREFSARAKSQNYTRTPDFLIAVFLIWTVGSQCVESGSITISIRLMIGALLDVVLPYYVASRYISRIDQFYDIAAVIVAALFVSALVAIFEATRSWLLYEAVKWKWTESMFNQFQVRGGILRAMAATATPISLGANLVVGLGFVYILRLRAEKKWRNSFIAVMLLAALFLTISRGPWIGGLAALIAWAAIGTGKFKRLSLLSILGGVGLIAILLSPFAESFVSLLPWIGTVEANTISYRETLIFDSLTVVLENPIFGDRNFNLHPLMARHAYEGGFIDMANEYLGYALVYGFFGLSLFVLIIGSSMLRLRTVVKSSVTNDNRLPEVARVIFGIFFGMAVIFGTTSIIGEMGTVLWLLVGLSSALYRLCKEQQKSSPSHELVTSIAAGSV